MPSSSGRASSSSATGRTGPWIRARSPPRSAIRPIRTSRSPASSRSRTPTATRATSRSTSPPRRAIAAVAHERGVPLHVDGARFFNAVVALGVRPAELAAAGRLGHVLPVEGPGLPGRLRRRRVAAVHRPGPPRPKAPRRRDAPVGRARGGRAGRAARRRRRDDHPPGGGPRERPAARPSCWRRSRAFARRATSPSPDDDERSIRRA